MNICEAAIILRPNYALVQATNALRVLQTHDSIIVLYTISRKPDAEQVQMTLERVACEQIERVASTGLEMTHFSNRGISPDQPPSFSFKSSCARVGLALPREAFITWPVRKPITLTLPAL